jgi:cytochrome c oxidase cbb3-type subunit 3
MATGEGSGDWKDRTPEPVAAHEYDGIVEHDNHLPLWWQLTLYGAVVFAMVYWFGRRLDAISSPAESYAQEVAVEEAAEAQEALKRGTVDDAVLSTMSRDPSTVAEGGEIFKTTCAACHRTDGGGNIGANLTDSFWIHGSKPLSILHTVHDGVPAKGMPTWAPQLGEQRVEAVVAYVLTIRNTNVPGGKAPQGVRAE